MAEVKGGDIRSLVEAYLQDTGYGFHITDKYELPFVSGMKLILSETEGVYQLKDIEVNGASIQNEQVYKLLFSEHIQLAFDRVCKNSTKKSLDVELADIWQTAIGDGNKIAEPEFYISIEK